MGFLFIYVVWKGLERVNTYLFFLFLYKDSVR